MQRKAKVKFIIRQNVRRKAKVKFIIRQNTFIPFLHVIFIGCNSPQPIQTTIVAAIKAAKQLCKFNVIIYLYHITYNRNSLPEFIRQGVYLFDIRKYLLNPQSYPVNRLMKLLSSCKPRNRLYEYRRQYQDMSGMKRDIR